MANALIAFLIAVGSCTWLFTKLQKSSGNNTQRSAMAASITGAVMFIIIFSVLALVF